MTTTPSEAYGNPYCETHKWANTLYSSTKPHPDSNHPQRPIMSVMYNSGMENHWEMHNWYNSNVMVELPWLANWRVPIALFAGFRFRHWTRNRIGRLRTRGTRPRRAIPRRLEAR